MTLKKTIIYLLVSVIVLAGLLSYPAYREIRSWRANAMAEEAEKMMKNPETMSRAWELAHAANSLLPEDPSIARTLARVYSASDPASSYPFWEKVVELSDNRPEDRLDLAKAYLYANLWEDFEAEIVAQREENLHPRQLDYLETLASTLKGNYEQALARVTALVAKENAPEEADTLFFQMTRISSDPQVRRAGIDHLWNIAAEEGPRQEEALKTLARLPDLERRDVDLLIDTIKTRENSSRDMLLLAEELRLRLPETDKGEIFDQVQTLFQLDEPDEMASLGRWLNKRGLQNYTLQAIPLETAMRRQDLFLIVLDAMALDFEWETIRTILDAPRIPLEDYLRESFRMRTYVEMGNNRRARLAWDRALVAAGRDAPKLYYLAHTARQLSLPDFEIAALQRVIDSDDMRKRATNELIEVLQRQKETQMLYDTLQEYIQHFPDDQSAENDVLYLSFLTNDFPPDALIRTKELLESQPNVLAYRMTLLLGLLRDERPEEAIDLLNGLPVNWFEVRDRWRLLTALALFRNGYEADAQQLAAQTNPSNLLPEELYLLEEIR